MYYTSEIILTFYHSQAKQQAHEHEMRNLALKAKEEASQAAKDLEKVRRKTIEYFTNM